MGIGLGLRVGTGLGFSMGLGLEEVGLGLGLGPGLWFPLGFQTGCSFVARSRAGLEWHEGLGVHVVRPKVKRRTWDRARVGGRPRAGSRDMRW